MNSWSNFKDTVFVDFLTSTGRVCHESDTLKVAVIGMALALLTFFSPAKSFAAGNQQWQSTESIQMAAENFIKERYGRNDSRMQPSAGHLDARLRLSRCTVPLEAFVRRGTKVASRTIVGVRCSGTKPWKVYVPVDVVVTEAVLVAKRTLPKGHILTAADVVTELRDISLLRGGYLADIEALALQRLKRQVDAGSIIAPSMLVADKLVRRGQMVTLIVKTDQMYIRMAGRALSDGALNQRIRVENSNSQRVVEGIVRSPEYVEVLVR